MRGTGRWDGCTAGTARCMTDKQAGARAKQQALGPGMPQLRLRPASPCLICPSTSSCAIHRAACLDTCARFSAGSNHVHAVLLALACQASQAKGGCVFSVLARQSTAACQDGAGDRTGFAQQSDRGCECIRLQAATTQPGANAPPACFLQPWARSSPPPSIVRCQLTARCPVLAHLGFVLAAKQVANLLGALPHRHWHLAAHCVVRHVDPLRQHQQQQEVRLPSSGRRCVNARPPKAAWQTGSRGSSVTAPGGRAVLPPLAPAHPPLARSTSRP